MNGINIGPVRRVPLLRGAGVCSFRVQKELEMSRDKGILREMELENCGLTILRFTILEVRKDMPNVFQTIEAYVFNRNPDVFSPA